jgi:tyrosinase
MLASYAKGVEAMLKLPADHPQNWFRNAFVHLMDCPHGNWWFYVWHRGYLGYFESSIRALSGDETFAIPYWDWTGLPQIPDGMFDGALTPTDKAFAPYTSNLAVFTSFSSNRALTNYWNSLSASQHAQLDIRGYKTFVNAWNDVTGFNPNVLLPEVPAFPKPILRDDLRFPLSFPRQSKTRQDRDLRRLRIRVYSGLLPTDFNNPVGYLSFTSSKTTSHNAPAGTFSTLEGILTTWSTTVSVAQGRSILDLMAT